MEQKTISRNDLLLTHYFYESFSSNSKNGKVWIMVEEGDGECCAIRVFDETIDDSSDIAYVLLAKEDAERFAQAVLVLSGARKVVS